jgi:hypothetical protein
LARQGVPSAAVLDAIAKLKAEDDEESDDDA